MAGGASSHILSSEKHLLQHIPYAQATFKWLCNQDQHDPRLPTFPDALSAQVDSTPLAADVSGPESVRHL